MKDEKRLAEIKKEISELNKRGRALVKERDRILERMSDTYQSIVDAAHQAGMRAMEDDSIYENIDKRNPS